MLGTPRSNPRNKDQKRDQSKVKLFAISASLIFTIAAGCDLQTPKTSDEYLADAHQLNESQQYRAAIITLKNSLQENSNNGEARILLGQIYTRLGESANAVKELQSALNLGVPLDSIALELGDALLMQGDIDTVYELYAIDESDSDKTRALKTLILGEAALQEYSYEQAALHFDTALSEENTRARGIIGQAKLALLLAQPDDALALIEQLTEPNNTEKSQASPLAYLVLADIMRAKKNTKGAITALDKAIASSHSDDFFYQIAVREKVYQQLKNNALADSKQSLELVKASPDNVQFGDDTKLVHALAVIAFQEKQYDQAYELCEKILVANPMHHGALLLCGTTATLQGSYVSAENHLSRFVALLPDHARGRKILAFVQAKNRRRDAALNTLNYLIVSTESPDPGTLALAGIHSLELGDYQTSNTLLKSAIDATPADSRLRFALAENLALKKEYDAAITQLSKIDQEAPDTKALFAIAELQVAKKEFLSALATLDKVSKLAPTNPMHLVWQGVIYRLTGEAEKASAKLAEAMTLDNKFYPTYKVLATAAIRSGELSTAEAYYRQAISNDSTNIEALQDYANLLVNQRRLAAAEKMLATAYDIDNKNIETIVSLAQLYIANAEPEKAIGILRAETENESTHPAIYAELGNAQKLRGDLYGALSSYKKLADIKQDSPVPQYLVATIQLALKNHEKAQQAFAIALTVDPEFTPALVASAQLSLKKQHLPEAKAFIEQIKEIKPGEKSLPLLQASLAKAEGNLSLAASIYEEYYESHPSNFVLQNLINTLWQNEDQNRALEILDKVTNEHEENTYALYLLGSAKSHAGDTPGAISVFEHIVSLNNKHAHAYHQLATLLKESSPEQALVYAETAHNLLPENSPIKRSLIELRKTTVKSH